MVDLCQEPHKGSGFNINVQDNSNGTHARTVKRTGGTQNVRRTDGAAHIKCTALQNQKVSEDILHIKIGLPMYIHTKDRSTPVSEQLAPI